MTRVTKTARVKRLAAAGVTLALTFPGVTLGASAATPLAPNNPLAPNPISPGLPASPAQTQTQPVQPVIPLGGTSTSADTGLSGSGAIAIAVGAMVVLGGIAIFIWRDARRRAPTRHRTVEATAGAGGRAGTKKRAKQRKLSPAERRRRKRGRSR